MKICIIGGIGSGKSEVLKVAKEAGICCLSADEINAQLLEDSDYIERIRQAFDNVVKDGKVDKTELSAQVFCDDAAREKLNSIAHPAIMERIYLEKADPLAVELPLVLESGAKDIFDEIVFVDTPVDLRIERLKGRGVTKERALAVMRAQVDSDELKKIATKVLDNGGSLQTLRRSAKALFEELLSKEK